MMKAFTTDDGVTHIVQANTPIAAPEPQVKITAHGDFRNWPEFQRELARLINTHSLERIAGLPDYVIAEYLTQCLVAMNVALLTTNPER